MNGASHPEWKPTASTERCLHIDIGRGSALYKKPTKPLVVSSRDLPAYDVDPRARAEIVYVSVLYDDLGPRHACLCAAPASVADASTPQRNIIIAGFPTAVYWSLNVRLRPPFSTRN